MKASMKMAHKGLKKGSVCSSFVSGILIPREVVVEKLKDILNKVERMYNRFFYKIFFGVSPFAGAFHL